MPPLHGQHQTILMFLSLNDVNSCLPVILAGDLGVCLVLRSNNQTLRAGLADLIFSTSDPGDAFGDCEEQSPVAHCFFAAQKSLVEPRRIELLTS
jgi:hypothetical protein